MLFKLSLVALIAFIGSVSCSLQGRVVNGIDSDIKRYPFMVSLRDAKGRHFCGGTIIAHRFILTAAHCARKKLASKLSIQYGTTVISAESKNVINVKRTITHKDFDILTGNNDIALLELKQPLVYVSKTVEAVKLPDEFFEVPQDKKSTPGVLLGWGRKTDFGEMESNLQEVEIQIYSDEECRLRKKAYATTKKLCAGVDEGGKGHCSGDSGGPLLSKDSVQLGIISGSVKPCASSPGIYTKVSHYKAWIAENLK